MAEFDPRFTKNMLGAFLNAGRQPGTEVTPYVMPGESNADYKGMKINPPSVSYGQRGIDQFGQKALEAFQQGKNFGQAFRGPPGIGQSEPNFTMEGYSNPRPNFTMMNEPTPRGPTTGSGIPETPGNGKFMGIDMGRSLVNMNDPDMRLARGVVQTGLAAARRNPMGVVSGLSQVAGPLKEMLGGSALSAWLSGEQQQNAQNLAPGSAPVANLNPRSFRSNMGPEAPAETLTATPPAATTPPAAPAEQQRQGYLTGSFGEAFKKARAAAGGGQGQFSYMGPDGQVRQYQTNIRGEKYVPTGRQTDVTSQIAPTLASAVQSQANAPAVATAPGIAPVPAGTPAYNDADRRYQTYIRQQQAAATQAGANQDIFPPFPGDPGEVIRAPKSLGGTGPDVSDVTVRQPGGFQSAVINKRTGEIVDQLGPLPPRERSYTVRQPEASPTGMKMPTPVGVRGGNLVFEGGGIMPIGDYEKLQQVVAPKPQPADQLNLLSTAITSASDQLNALPKDSPEYNRLLARKNSYELQRKMMLENLSKKPFEGGGLNAAIEALQTR